MALREILVELGIEVDRRKQEQAQGAVDRLSTSLGRLKKFAIGAGAVFLTGRIAQGFGSIITQAGDAAEIANKFGAVFDDVAPRITKSLEEMALRTGQSRIAIQEMTADAGALVKPLLGNAEAAGDLATSMTEAALDIASFENVLPQEALVALRSAIIGSSEPMLRFGVDTRQAALQQFALEKGLKKSIKEMSAAEVTALRMELIMKRLGDKGAVGDATRTAGSFTNRLRAFQGAVRDLTAAVGDRFLPMATDFLGVLIKLARSENVKEILDDIASILGSVGKAVAFVFRVFRGLFILLGPLGLAFAFAGVKLLLFVSAMKAAGLVTSAQIGRMLLLKAVAVAAAVKAAAAWLLAAAPFILIGVLLALLIEDLIAWAEGSDSVIGTMIEGFKGLVDEIGSIPGAIFEMLATAFEFWAKFFQDTLGLSDEFIENMTETLRTAWTTTIEFWGSVFDDFIGGIMKAFDAVSGFFSDLFGGDEAEEKANLARKRAEEAARLRGQERGEANGVASPTAGAEGRARIATGLANIAAAGRTGTAVPVTRGMSPAARSNTMINQPRNETVVNIDASGTGADPKVLGGVVRREIEAVTEQSMRQTNDAFATALAEG